jgi:hypothetical protein
MIANSKVRPASPVVKRWRTVSNGATSEVTIGAASTREGWTDTTFKTITTNAAIATNAAPNSTTSVFDLFPKGIFDFFQQSFS